MKEDGELEGENKQDEQSRSLLEKWKNKQRFE